MSRQSFYDLHDRPAAAAFRRAVEAALDSAMTRIDEGAISRAIEGVPRPIFYKGEQVGEYRHFDERLTMFLLRYRRPHRYGAHLDRLPPPPPPRLPPGIEDEGPDPDEAIGQLDGAGDVSRAEDGVNFVNFVGNAEGDSDADDRHPGPEPGSAFSWNDQTPSDDDCDRSEAPVERRP